ncbi:MAG: hypothetical protein L3K03_00470 [Thermoplasmata archaeon]|nr:hypothetical protein [Thermoplasmata archaeon]
MLALIDVANLRRNSAILWVATWTIFLSLVAIGVYAAQADVYGDFYVFAFAGLLLFIALPAIASVSIGFFSSVHWGEEYRSLVGDPLRLPLAWAPGIRSSKEAWNRSRLVLWISWAIGPAVILLGWLTVETGVDDHFNVANNPAPEIFLAVLALMIMVFMLLRGLHHYYFARSMILATEEVVPELGPGYWARTQWQWLVGTFAVPFDPIFLLILALLLIGLAGEGGSEAPFAPLTAIVVGAGIVSIGAGVLLLMGYWQLGNVCRRWMAARQMVPGKPHAGVPPEWIQS